MHDLSDFDFSAKRVRSTFWRDPNVHRHVLEQFGVPQAVLFNLPFGQGDWTKRTHTPEDQVFWIDAEQWGHVPWGLGLGNYFLFDGGRAEYESVFLHESLVPNPFPKPTWDEVWTAFFPNVLSFLEDGKLVESPLKKHRDGISNAPVALDGIKSLHVGDGLEHMPAIIHALSAATNAGRLFAPAVLRHADGNGQSHLWTQEQAHRLLDQMTEQTNVGESVYNVVRHKYDAILAPFHNRENTHESRAAAITAAQAFAHPDNLAKETAKVKKMLGGLPEDLPTLKVRLGELLEAKANEHINFLKGVVSQQGHDLPAACLDAQNAETEVAKEVNRGEGNITNADTIQQAKAAYNTAVAKIENVKAVNSPIFHLRGSSESLGAVESYEATSVSFTVIQPDMVGSVLSLVASHSPGSEFRITRRGRLSIDFDCSLGAGQDKAEFGLRGRNLCGPTRMKVTLVPPAS